MVIPGHQLREGRPICPASRRYEPARRHRSPTRSTPGLARPDPGHSWRLALAASHAALLPTVIAARTLDRHAGAGPDPFDPALARADPWQSWRLALAALRRRF